MTLYRLVYYSANRIGGSPSEFSVQINNILEASRRNNPMVGVTGALMFSGGYFGQVLEGPQGAIEATFERIQQDPRHGDVSLLESVPVELRTFDNWAMAYVGSTGDFADFGHKTGLQKIKFLEIVFSKSFVKWSQVRQSLPEQRVNSGICHSDIACQEGGCPGQLFPSTHLSGNYLLEVLSRHQRARWLKVRSQKQAQLQPVSLRLSSRLSA